jgi:DNA-nicking Smr family endonuclease
VAKRKKNPQQRNRGPEPFNNPFGEGLRQLRTRMRKVPDAVVTSHPAAARHTKPTQAPPVGDAESFLDAVSGTVPLEKPRRRIKPQTEITRDVDVSGAETVADLAADEHFDLRFSDRFIRASANGVSRETVAKLERGEFAVRSHVDLHGMALDDARCVVDQFLAERQKRGERCVLVITGKGRNSRHQVGVLREKIPEWLARGPSARRVLAFVTARTCDGGEGALYVLLRREASAKARIDIIAGGGA